MSRKGNRKRREERRSRVAERLAERLARRASLPPIVHGWQNGEVRLGKHPDCVLRFKLSGVRLPFDDNDPEPNAGLQELTALALGEAAEEAS